jgi:hypothetical protein
LMYKDSARKFPASSHCIAVHTRDYPKYSGLTL